MEMRLVMSAETSGCRWALYQTNVRIRVTCTRVGIHKPGKKIERNHADSTSAATQGRGRGQDLDLWIRLQHADRRSDG
jgi:hypothetical protein